MKVAFRADASLHIGSGHVMRCLTLADALRAQGAQCHFICRAHHGHLMEVIRQRGYEANSLLAQVDTAQFAIKNVAPTDPEWLGSTWQADAHETCALLARLQPDWLVVDHYALDQRWENLAAPYCGKLMVIDDLTDRPHHCDLLLNQNLGQQAHHYAALVPTHCLVLTGPNYALLRPEFSALRSYSLQRRKAQPALRSLLITMGGVDQGNATGQVLQALKTSALPADCQITVVMGLTAPWLHNVRDLAAHMPWPTEVVVNVNDMAQRLADSDSAIGAAGSTSWERCCLGVPTLMLVLADNQQHIASSLENAGASVTLGLENAEHFAHSLANAIEHFAHDETVLASMSQAAAKVTEGVGAGLVVAQMLGKHSA